MSRQQFTTPTTPTTSDLVEIARSGAEGTRLDLLLRQLDKLQVEADMIWEQGTITAWFNKAGALKAIRLLIAEERDTTQKAGVA